MNVRFNSEVHGLLHQQFVWRFELILFSRSANDLLDRACDLHCDERFGRAVVELPTDSARVSTTAYFTVGFDRRVLVFEIAAAV